MKPTRAQITLAAISGVTGGGALACLVLLIRWAANDSTNTTRVFVVGVIATLASPIAFALIQTAWRLVRPPSLDLIRRQAVAARQLERELADWEYAESQREQAEATRAEIEIYIEFRTRSLDLDRRMDSWIGEAMRLHEELEELLELGRELDRDIEAELSVEAKEVLDRIVEPGRTPWERAFDIFLATTPWPINRIVTIATAVVRETGSLGSKQRPPRPGATSGRGSNR